MQRSLDPILAVLSEAAFPVGPGDASCPLLCGLYGAAYWRHTGSASVTHGGISSFSSRYFPHAPQTLDTFRVLWFMVGVFFAQMPPFLKGTTFDPLRAFMERTAHADPVLDQEYRRIERASSLSKLGNRDVCNVAIRLRMYYHERGTAPHASLIGVVSAILVYFPDIAPGVNATTVLQSNLPLRKRSVPDQIPTEGNVRSALRTLVERGIPLAAIMDRLRSLSPAPP